MPEPLTPYTLTSAEADLFELVNLAHEQQFSVTISRLGDAWTVKLADVDVSDVHEGQGTTSRRLGPRCGAAAAAFGSSREAAND